ncbi:MBL fold metallo-hydrolase [Microvirga terrae]|uniref:MBL fold metallo-hydrolase n=1 Tax=Microvirga terrae TaxID=2740529 RepID=A0ABY5RXG7_9HYPH|nr:MULTISPECIES: MBL fold metallo-hydrolase [Microvirga]UVF21629.1 MBL fold metallo-hydrolase [Microvirga terrae]
MSLRPHFHGAARTVTGSCWRRRRAAFWSTAACSKVSKEESNLNSNHFPFRAAGIGALCLTHAHIDHSGLVPKLVKAGFGGLPTQRAGGI